VTHDQTEAMSMADRIVVMNGGHVQQVGRPEYLFSQQYFTVGAGQRQQVHRRRTDKSGDEQVGRVTGIRLASGWAFDRNILPTAWRRAICACRPPFYNEDAHRQAKSRSVATRLSPAPCRGGGG
jgi:ABC-type sugar transport system ATPase subunit